jgi:hypothetical protein
MICKKLAQAEDKIALPLRRRCMRPGNFQSFRFMQENVI